MLGVAVSQLPNLLPQGASACFEKRFAMTRLLCNNVQAAFPARIAQAVPMGV